MREVPSAYERHLGTAIWYYGGKGYIANVRLENKADVFALSLCAFTPSFGMDKIDELFAQDIEESILNQKLGFSTERLDIFQGRKSVPVGEYLRARGVIE